MNAFIEENATKHPEQYMWMLKLLSTREDGRNIYHELDHRNENYEEGMQ
jgi:lauroyl/myristoyl acyltransferase